MTDAHRHSPLPVSYRIALALLFVGLAGLGALIYTLGPLAAVGLAGAIALGFYELIERLRRRARWARVPRIVFNGPVLLIVALFAAVALHEDQFGWLGVIIGLFTAGLLYWSTQKEEELAHE